MDLRKLSSIWHRNTNRRGNRKEDRIWDRSPHLNVNQNSRVSGTDHTENMGEAILEKMSDNLPELLKGHFSEPGSPPLIPHHLAETKQHKKGQEE